LDYSAIHELLAKSQQVVITTHRSPDGDAMGSALALALVLRKKGLKASVVVPNSYPPFLAWMPEASSTIIYEEEGEKAKTVTAESELIFCLDFNNLNRLEGYGDVVKESGKPLILIDHHLSPESYFLHALSDTSASSTCELIHRFFVGMEWTELIDRDVAECLYTGIMTDTGSFRFSSTSAQTHRVVADLMDRGLVPERVYHHVFDTNRFERLQLLGHALGNKMKYDADLHTAVIPISLREKNRYHYRKGDTEGLVNYGLSILGSRMSIFISEEDGYCKLSLRSKGELDVNQIARQYFNGGGHKNAAGGRLDLSLDESLSKIDSVLQENRSLLA